MLKLTDHGDYLSVNPILVERNCCKQAFIRGAFLATGSLTDPEKGYHFEIVCDHAEQADMLARLIRDFQSNRSRSSAKNIMWFTSRMDQ